MPPKHALASTPGASASRYGKSALTSNRGRGNGDPSQRPLERAKRVQVAAACWYCRKKKVKVCGVHLAVRITRLFLQHEPSAMHFARVPSA